MLARPVADSFRPPASQTQRQSLGMDPVYTRQLCHRWFLILQCFCSPVWQNCFRKGTRTQVSRNFLSGLISNGGHPAPSGAAQQWWPSSGMTNCCSLFRLRMGAFLAVKFIRTFDLFSTKHTSFSVPYLFNLNFRIDVESNN